MPCLPSPWNHTLRPALHTQGAPARPASTALPPSRPGAHTTDVVAVVSGPQTCRLESGASCFSAAAVAGGGEAQVPLQKAHAEAPSPYIFIHTPHTHVHTCMCTHRLSGKPGGPSSLAALEPKHGNYAPVCMGPSIRERGRKQLLTPFPVLAPTTTAHARHRGWPPHPQTFPLEEALCCLVLSKPQDHIKRSSTFSPSR